MLHGSETWPVNKKGVGSSVGWDEND